MSKQALGKRDARRTSTSPSPSGQDSALAAWCLWAVLALLAAARLLLEFVPSMAAWGLNVDRFVPSPWAWVLLSLPAVALLPALARPVAAWLDRRRVNGTAWQVAMVAAAATLVAAFPDRVWFTGDFIGRQFSLDAPGSGVAWYTHAVPLDLALHQQLGHLLVTRWGLEANDYGRLLGVLEAGALAWSASLFARALDLEGVTAISAASLVFWGGWLALFTGYNKALSETVLVVALFGGLGLRVVREGRGIVALASVLAAGLLLHRSALALIPAFVSAWLVWWRRVDPGHRRQRAAALSLAIPVLTLLLEAPQVVTIVREFDVALFVPLGTRSGAQGDTRALDLLNAIALLSPAGLASIPLGIALGRAWRRPEGPFLAAVVAPLTALALLFYPPEGLFRFWDIFAGLGVALSMLTAWMAAVVLAEAPSRRWLGISLALAAACPSLSFLIHNAHDELGLQRVQAYLREPPARAPMLRATAHEFLGFRLIDLGRPAEAAAEFARAAEMVPSPRVLRQWATAESMAGDLVAAQAVLRRIAERDSTSPDAWRSLAIGSLRAGDTTEAARSLVELARLDPADTVARRLLIQLTPGARSATPR